MSLIPRQTYNTPTNFTPFTQDFWDTFFSSPFPSFPFPFGRTIPYTELSLETSGDVRAKLECKEIEEAHLIVAELPGVGKDEVDVAAEEGGFVRISGGDGRFFWRMRVPGGVRVDMMSWSMENGVLTVVVPKVGVDMGWGWGSEGSEGRDVRLIEITGDD